MFHTRHYNLLQLLQNLVCIHPTCEQLLNHTLGFRFLGFFGGLLIGGSFLGFQLGQLLLGGLECQSSSLSGQLSECRC